MLYETFKEKVFAGTEIDLLSMLEARENRAQHQQKLFENHREATVLLSVTLNIPGDIKNSDYLEKIFMDMMKKIKQQLTSEQIISHEVFHLDTGSEAYIMVEMDPFELKTKMARLEENNALGRLFDIDVLVWNDHQQVRAIKRQEVGLKIRRCFVCNQPAKECARSRKHSVEEMYEVIVQLLEENE